MFLHTAKHISVCFALFILGEDCVSKGWKTSQQCISFDYSHGFRNARKLDI